jgi:hypothetical protein
MTNPNINCPELTRQELAEVLLELASRVEQGHNLGMELSGAKITTYPYRVEDRLVFSVQELVIMWGESP